MSPNLPAEQVRASSLWELTYAFIPRESFLPRVATVNSRLSEAAVMCWREIRFPTLRWMHEQNSIDKMRRLQEALEKVMSPDFISVWLMTPNPAFDGLKPVEVIERGEIDRIWRMIVQLESGVAS